MLCLKKPLLALGAALLTVTPPASHAAMAVIDSAAIAQLVEQVSTMRAQLDTLTWQLDQARQEFTSITGTRGMESLLGDTVRNYLPPDWDELTDAIEQTSATYRALSGQIRAAIDANAFLEEKALAQLPASTRAVLEEDRRAVALLQVMSREALATTSSRFASIQELIDAIPTAQDQKAILDLQARIQAEQGMLANEATKLQLYFRAAQAQERAQQQRIREQVIAGIGSWAALPPLRLSVDSY